jgi:hypothetical protein
MGSAFNGRRISCDLYKVTAYTSLTMNCKDITKQVILMLLNSGMDKNGTITLWLILETMMVPQDLVQHWEATNAQDCQVSIFLN